MSVGTSRSENLRAVVEEQASDPEDSIAIVGIGCRFPGGGNSPDTFWENLVNGVSGISEIPEERWSLEGFFDPDPQVTSRSVTKWGGFVDGMDLFDAAFFGISPREAANMDPQQRLMLQVTWEGLEDAGIAADRLAGSATGVFVGVSINDYAILQKYSTRGHHIHAGTGTALSIVANRISHRLDLRGPSVSIDTACSSSLTALDLACRSLREGRCTLALAGGVNALIDPNAFLYFSSANMMSPDGCMHVFDAAANGFVRAEGGGVVVLKRLSAALRNRDRVYAVIRGTAVNQDGRTSTITVPSREAQTAMMVEACRSAGVAPAQVVYVEAHGTGTVVGDPIEAGAIGEVFGAARRGKGPVRIGSVKTYTGHLESGAGITSVVKTALCLHHGLVPPNLHFRTPNPSIPFDDLNLEVVDKPLPLEEGGAFAAVNSFGFGGTNACAILETAPPPVLMASGVSEQRLEIVPISAASATALTARAGQIAQFLCNMGDQAPTLQDLAASLALRRAHLGHRLAVISNSVPDLVAKLEAFAAGTVLPNSEEGAPPTIVSGRSEEAQPAVFIFAGQGGQSWQMARELLETDSVFRSTVEAFDEVFRGIAGWSVMEELLADEAHSQIHATRVTQPAIFAVQIGLVARWRAFGIEPAAVIGHSFGEVAAAYTCGALSIEDAAAIIYHRGRLQDEMQGYGGMAAIGLSADEIRRRLAEAGEERIEVAAINGPSIVTVAGDRDALQCFVDDLESSDSDMFCRILKVDYAAHSKQMESIREPFVNSLGNLAPRPPAIPMISTVTGAEVDAEALDAEYWYRNLRFPVLFQETLARATAKGYRTFIEIGPHATLSGLASACLLDEGIIGAVVPSLHAKHGDRDMLYAALATLHVRGFDLNWEELALPGRPPVKLPSYPWENQRFWSDSEESRWALQEAPVHPLLGKRLRSARPVWTNEIDLNSFRFIADHCVDGSVVFPAAGYIDMLFAAARDVFGDAPWELEEVTFHEALFLPEDCSVILETVFDPDRRRLQIFSRVRDESPEWTLRVTGRARQGAPGATSGGPHEQDGEPIGREAFYAHVHGQGHEYGPTFQGVERIWPGEGVSVGDVVLPETLTSVAERYLMHPALLDACLQVGIGIGGKLTDKAEKDSAIYLPTSMARVRFYRRPVSRVRVQVRLVRMDRSGGASDLVVTDETGEVVLLIQGFASRRLPSRTTQSSAGAALLPYRETWHEAALELPLSDAGEGRQGLWLVLAEPGRTRDSLAAGLKAAGYSVVCAGTGGSAERIDSERFTIRGSSTDDMNQLISEVAQHDQPLVGVTHLLSLDRPLVGSGAEVLSRAQDAGTLSVLYLVQSLARHEALAPRLWIATRGARYLGAEIETGEADADGIWRLAGAPLVGLARTIATEYEHLRCTVVDLDPGAHSNGEGAAADLLAEILADSPEPEVALRGDRRYVNRVEAGIMEALPPKLVPARSADGTKPFRLTMTSPGVFEDMVVVETDAAAPGPGEIAIEVHAVGLNFHDILSAAGLMPEGSEDVDAFQFLGLECAGVVVAVGEGVEQFRPGDRVMAPGKGCLAATVVIPGAFAQPVPDGIDLAEAATVPTAFTTAHFALNHLGRMKAGDKVLIHVATGGVGLAAIQLARLKGAEIFATAGSDQKRSYLRELGIEHVMNSRSLDFADEVLAATGGRGVDIVLNSLPGDFIDKGIEVLAPHGRFLELGKRDLFSDKPLGLWALRDSKSFVPVDLDGLGRDRPEEMKAAFAEVADMLASGRIQPLPLTEFPMSRVSEAFRYMSQARHIGKVVVAIDDPELEVALAADRPLQLRADGTYLVTGGLGGFGLEVSRWLGRSGAGHLVLMGRSGASSDEAKAVLAEIEAEGTQVTVIAGDVTRSEDVERAVAIAAESGHHLRGVIHAAMVLDDGFLSQLDDERFVRVLGPKMLGAWNLHEATRNAELDFFVLFSSIAAMLGSTGQGNYVAGNAFLEALAQHRRAIGLPALSIGWGALAGAGFVARHAAIAHYLESLGVAAIPVEESLGALGRLLNRDPGSVTVARIDWSRLAKAQSSMAASPRIAHLLVGADGGRGPGGRVRGELLRAPAARRTAILDGFLREQVARVLRVDPASIEANRGLNELGLDSLTSFELKNRIETELGVSLPAGKFLQRPTIAGLSEAILEQLESVVEQEAGAEPEVERPDEHPLTRRQEWLWRLSKQPHTAPARYRSYLRDFAMSIRPRVDAGRLQGAFERVAERHSALRTVFPERNDRPVQVVLERHPSGVEVHDTAELADPEFRELLLAEVEEPYDIENGPLIRFVVYRRPDDTDVLLVRFHHLVTDGWSAMVMMRELFAEYLGVSVSEADGDGQARMQFVDYARWQRTLVEGPEGVEQREYWRKRLRSPGPPLQLPYDRPRGEEPVQRGAFEYFSVENAKTTRLKRLAAHEQSSWYAVLLAAFKVLIYGYTGRTDVLVGAPAAARTRPEFEGIVGWLAERMVTRSSVDEDLPFSDLVVRVTENLRADLAYQNYPSTSVMEEIEAATGGRTCLDQVGFHMERPDNIADIGLGKVFFGVPGARVSMGSLEIAAIPLERWGTLRELTMHVLKIDDEIHGYVNYAADLFERSTIQRLIRHYQLLLEAIAEDPTLTVGELSWRCLQDMHTPANDA